jgi:hypothetical protein
MRFCVHVEGRKITKCSDIARLSADRAVLSFLDTLSKESVDVDDDEDDD